MTRCADAVKGGAHQTIRGVLLATVREEGLLGLYRGVGPTLAGILPYAGLKFFVYQVCYTLTCIAVTAGGASHALR